MCTPTQIIPQLHNQGLITFPVSLSEQLDPKGNTKKKLIPPKGWQHVTESIPLKPNDKAYAILTGRASNIFVVDWDLDKNKETRDYLKRLLIFV
jgi:hypothetical protein